MGDSFELTYSFHLHTIQNCVLYKMYGVADFLSSIYCLRLKVMHFDIMQCKARRNFVLQKQRKNISVIMVKVK